MNVGNKVRQTRTKLGLNMKEFAERIGISYLTLFRIETDKVSPSVSLLSEIAHHLGQPITDFLQEKKQLTLVRKGKAPVVESRKLKLELLLPKGVVNEKVSVSLGDACRGEFVSKHSHRGFEVTYHIRGKSLFRYGAEQYELNEGDLICFDSSVEHSVIALEPVTFLSFYFRK
jgi:transcriptional regulator with XRE-family HTH domain